MCITASSQKGDLYLDLDGDCLELRTSYANIDHYFVTMARKYPVEYQIEVSQDGNLKKNKWITGGTGSPSIFLNTMNKNEVLKVTEDQMMNKLNCTEILYRKNTDLKRIFENFKNVYLVRYDKTSNLYFATLVSYKFNQGM